MYTSIVYVQGDEAYPILDLIADGDYDSVMSYLMQWETGDETDIRDEPAWGDTDRLYRWKNYVLSWDARMSLYVALTRVEAG